MSDPLDIQIGGRMRALRTMRRLSLEQVGERVGLSYQQIRKYESGENRISAANLYRVSQVLGVDVQHFFIDLSGSGQRDLPIGESAEGFTELLNSLQDKKIRSLLKSLLLALKDKEKD